MTSFAGPRSAVGLFQALASRPTPGGDALAAIALGHARDAFAAIDSHGRACFLLRLADAAATSRPLLPRLENVVVEHEVACVIETSQDARECGVFTVIVCVADSPRLRDLFVLTVDAIVRSLVGPYTVEQLNRVVGELVDLFHALRGPRRKAISGLWAELLVIERSPDSGSVARAWHQDPFERYDFSAPAEMVEVKASGTRERLHHFTLAQAYPPDGARALVASVFVERRTGGLSLGSLWSRINDRVTAASRVRIQQIVARSLGEDAVAALDYAFDYELASESLAFFELSTIPRPPHDLGRGIYEVTFVSDVSLAVRATQSSASGVGGLVAACLAGASPRPRGVRVPAPPPG